MFAQGWTQRWAPASPLHGFSFLSSLPQRPKKTTLPPWNGGVETKCRVGCERLTLVLSPINVHSSHIEKKKKASGPQQGGHGPAGAAVGKRPSPAP